jgi:hypothetical protein
MSPFGWREGDRFLWFPEQGSTKAMWSANASRLRAEMRQGQPIYETYVNPDGSLIEKGGFLGAERAVLEHRGWTYTSQTRAWTPPR